MEYLNYVWIAMAAVGAIFLVLSIFGGDTDGIGDLDGDFDISDTDVSVDSPSVFSIKFLATFFLAFGIADVVVFYNGDGSNVWTQILWGVVSGGIVTVLYFFAMKFMYSQQGSSMSTAQSLIGKIAIVSIPTTDLGKGQVRIPTNTGNTEYSCVELSGKKLKQNQTVEVVSVVDAGTLLVKTSK